jgi:1,4-dihydroxy-2-naphthoate octaprenyltransferase
MGSFIVTVPIGIYFLIVRGWLLLPLLIIGALCILAYTPFVLKMSWPEWAAGVGLGTLPVLGVYYTQTATFTIDVLVVSVPFGILVHNLLLLNEFPDVQADQTVNRKTLPIVLGKKRAGIIYSVLMVIVYLWITVGVVIGIMPVFSAVSLLTFPISTKAIQGALNPEKLSNLIPAMANNVLVVLLTPFLLGVGYILSGFF